ncbi:phenylalanyl-tRNA synthetase beta subunit [Geoalkalibacter ferrihydriticus]|uniref:Phenylalanine--tRNA ligase beta subunit n=2 Tax=Geoalkalibacter ferrihydriticus TaxID=392333 RepID=A0A0C2EFL1_9BACT|nr:phenylalanine--tRNA ligase subunit beta [Geoalkalibacter ferrihydriticus]KIH77398.1 phenylalanyl-tRNA synthetase subunit beta [Geoalkalibacter ferrihydriticus DSM 17813]SDM16712.1 phenylalanyl-tRNA synthetase beta subunit [Geoalkalibacter ferrihydriticus]
MILTYNWLKEYVDCDLSPEELAHRLTMTGLEVDSMEKIGEGLDTVIVARLQEVAAHPDADRLTVCRVDTGADVVQVVCGAKNHKTGDLVALAQVGTVLPGDFKIKKSKIRGQESYGMLCSEKELGLAEDAEGILILPADLIPGTPVFDALGLKDVRFELGLTPNRADCLSVVGVAREVAALTGKSLRLPQPLIVEDDAPITEQTSVTIEEPGMCPRYAARLIRGVQIGPSPQWIVRRLESIGLRSINNVVDVTNFVLMELGHPLHAFDFSLLRGGRILVRRAGDGEKFMTLDSQERTLNSGDLTICDAQGPVALAGIMGGENSEIRPDTVDILLESAFFNPPTIRRTSKRLGLHSESSHRFERGADVDMVPRALDRAAALIVEVAGGTLAKGAIDCYPQPIAPRKLSISAEKTSRLLGIDIDIFEIQSLLRSIALAAELAADRKEDVLYVEVPTFRPDLEREVDLIEEVARLKGYEHIPTTMPQGRILCQREPELRSLERRLRDTMVACGFNEVINYSFNSPTLLDRLGLAGDDGRRHQVRLLNPLNEEQSVLRTTLVPSLLQTVAQNLAHRSAADLRLFELRPVFLPRENEDLPEENPRLTALMCGRRSPLGWSQSGETVDFFDIKGVVEELLGHLRLQNLSWRSEVGESFYHPGKSCALYGNEQLLGNLGEIHPRVLSAFEIEQAVFLFDLDLGALSRCGLGRTEFTALSRFPGVYRDSAMLFDETVTAQQILDVVHSAKAQDMEDVVLFDVYRGKGIAGDKKSVAIRVRYRSAEKTLTDEEISKAHGRIIRSLENQLGAEIR